VPKVDDAHFAARRRQILDAAAACFAREGFHRTSVQDIVRESGVSAGLVYRYFQGKDDMIAAIVAERHEYRAAVLGADPAAGFIALLRSIGDPAARDDLRLRVQVWAETIRSAPIRELARAGVEEPIRLTAPALAGVSAQGADPAAVARVLIAVYQGLVLQTVWDDDLDHAAFVHAVEVLLAGLLPPSSQG